MINWLSIFFSIASFMSFPVVFPGSFYTLQIVKRIRMHLILRFKRMPSNKFVQFALQTD